MTDLSSYRYADAQHHAHHYYLDPVVLAALEQVCWKTAPRRVFELGCGNGSFANIMRERGYVVTAVDPSTQGITFAKAQFPGIAFHTGSADDQLSSRFGQFQAVVSLEVVEHVFQPRNYAAALFDLLVPGGVAIISTPYHSYLKNLALAASGRMDAHFTALVDHGHIKFWSIRTLRALLAEAGFDNIVFHRVGRVPVLAKSLVAIARRP